MKKITNRMNIPLPLAVWLARDTYDYGSDPITYMSATEIMKSMKSLILSRRIPIENQTIDLHDLVPSRIGTAIHDSIEKAWLGDYNEKLVSMGFDPKMADKIKVNPTDTDDEQIIPVYMEQRSSKVVNGVTVSGKFDFVFNGRVVDFKSTSTFTYINKSNNEKYQMQGSIYRWLNPDIITDDMMEIHFIFTDWKPTLAQTQKDYPPARAMSLEIPLLPIEAVEQHIQKKIIEYKSLIDADERDLVPCNAEELWRKPSVWKYYANPAKTQRSTKNFDNPQDAQIHLNNKGVGIINEVKGEVVACRYCDAFSICKQKDAYLASGELKN